VKTIKQSPSNTQSIELNTPQLPKRKTEAGSPVVGDGSMLNENSSIHQIENLNHPYITKVKTIGNNASSKGVHTINEKMVSNDDFESQLRENLGFAHSPHIESDPLSLQK
jgi:hypothetical protein